MRWRRLLYQGLSLLLAGVVLAVAWGAAAPRARAAVPPPAPHWGQGAFPGYPKDTTYQAIAASAPALPPLRGFVEDPSTQTILQRITAYDAEAEWYPHHEYAKIQPWNADGTLYRFYSVAIYDAQTHQRVRWLPGDIYPTVWANTDPHLLYSFRDDGTIQTYDVVTGAYDVLGRLTGYDRVALGPGEGNIDIHDHFVALVGKKGADLDVVVFDLQHRQVVTVRTFPGAWGNGGSMPQHVDWVSVSQSGRYVVINWNSGPPWDVQPFDGHYGVEAYRTTDMAFLRRLVRYGNHGDLCFTPAGGEVYVQFWGENGTINAYHLDRDQADVIHTADDFGVGDAHLSCRNILRPGWAYVSTDPDRGGLILAVKLDGSQTVEYFGHHFSSAANYLKSPMPVPSPDGRRVMFKSDFGDAADADVVYDFEASASDAQRLYDDVTIDIFTNQEGAPSFTATRSDGQVLREAFQGERFWEDHSDGALSLSYSLEEAPAGVNVVYTITNPSDAPQPLPDLYVDGLTYAAHDEQDTLQILATGSYPYLHLRSLSEDTFQDGQGNFRGWGYFEVNGEDDFPYPSAYAPVIVAHDGHFAAGSALLVDYPHTGLQPRMRVWYWQGHWSHVYDFGVGNQTLPPGATLTLTLTLRFAPPRAWLLTLYPYRAFFDGLYGGQRQIAPRDLRPISGLNLSYSTVAYEQYQACLNAGDCEEGSEPDEQTVLEWNLRGHNWALRTDKYGLDGPNPDHDNRGFVSTYVQRLREAGYSRAMLWGFSGQFWKCPPEAVVPGEHPYCDTNLPPQFMSDLLSPVANSLDALAQFGEQGIDLGFWWGRAGQVPQPRQWNPDAVPPLDPDDADDAAFADQELALAVARGAHALGLDAFPNMAPLQQLPWLAHLKAQAPDVALWVEGAMSDYLHTRAALFLQPDNPWSSGRWTGTPLTAPPLLMQYLNPGAAVIAYRNGYTPTAEELQQMVHWGYTPLLVAAPDIFDTPLTDVHSTAGVTLAACFDGQDNDHDGWVDFPYDPDCLSAAGESEGASPYPTFPDMPTDDWAWPYVESLVAEGVTSGYPDGLYHPQDQVTRAQSAVFLLRAIHGGDYAPPPAAGNTFPDVAGHWAADWIEEAADEGLVHGYADGTYRPDRLVSRAEVAVLLLRSLHGPDYTPPAAAAYSFSDIAGHWAADWIEQLHWEGAASGYPDGTYHPDASLTRAEMAALLVRYFGYRLPE